MEAGSPLTNMTMWFRIAVVASAVWVGGTIITSNLIYDFKWFPYTHRNDYSFGPAAITANVGVLVIFAVCLGIPWIAQSYKKS
jgi:hypothetical protein